MEDHRSIIMRSRVIALAVAAAALGVGSLAWAHDDGREYRDWRQAQQRQFQENWFYLQQLQNDRERFAERLYERRQRAETRHGPPQYDGYGYPYEYPGRWDAPAPRYR